MDSHSKNAKVVFKKKLDEPITIINKKVNINKKIVGKKYRSNAQKIIKYFDNLSQEEIITFNENIKEGEIMINIDALNCSNNSDNSDNLDNSFLISSDMIDIVDIKKTVTHEEMVPHTIEPSFGIDRLMYSIFEHNFWLRKEDNRRIVLSLPNILTPYDIGIFQLYNRDDMIKLARNIRDNLMENKFSCYMDQSNVAIGKRYVRADEMGIKYCITIDPGSLEDNSVTIRDRDSMNQIRVNINSLSDKIICDVSLPSEAAPEERPRLSPRIFVVPFFPASHD